MWGCDLSADNAVVGRMCFGSFGTGRRLWLQPDPADQAADRDFRVDSLSGVAAIAAGRVSDSI